MLRLAKLNASNVFYHITEQSGVLQLVLQGWILGGESQYNYQREQLEFLLISNRFVYAASGLNLLSLPIVFCLRALLCGAHAGFQFFSVLFP